MATKALVKPELLTWTRNRAKMTVEDAAKAARVTVDEIETWEAGSDAPTLSQLRLLAAKYHFPLAVFYLPEPPTDFAPLRDFRRLPDTSQGGISPHLAFHIRNAYERRELALELHDDLRETVQGLVLKTKLGTILKPLAKLSVNFLVSMPTLRCKPAGRIARSTSGAAASRSMGFSFS